MSFWRWRFSISFVLLAGLGMLPGFANGADSPSRHGKTLVRSYELPADLLDQYNLAVLASPDDRLKPLADIPPWMSSEFRTAAGEGPYTLVVAMLGAALESDAMFTRWQPSWGNTPGVMPAMVEPGAKAGELLQLVLASQPLQLEEGQLVSPTLRLVDAKNIRLERVRVEVWSGVGETSWLEWLVDWWKVPVTAALWLALFFYWRHDRRKAAIADAEAEGGTSDGTRDGSGDPPAEK